MLPSVVAAVVVAPVAVLVAPVVAVAVVVASRRHDAGPVESSIVPDLGLLPSDVLGPDKNDVACKQFKTKCERNLSNFSFLCHGQKPCTRIHVLYFKVPMK